MAQPPSPRERPRLILTPKEMLQAGLEAMHYSADRINRVKNQSTNIQRFKDHFGCHPHVAATIFEELQITRLDSARLGKNKVSAFYFLASLYFLKVYETEKRREPIFDLSPKTMRNWVWYYVRKIQALKEEKIRWPDGFPPTDVWVVSIDCTDCPIEEISHPTLSQDPELYSFKLAGAGLQYEFGIDLFYSNVLWMNGPFKPGKYNDNTIFAEFGLKAKLAACGKKGLADKIYNGHPNECATFNAIDSKMVKEFKARVQMRHEIFNSLVKEFKVTSTKFRHKENKIEQHKSCFEAVTVICQYKLEYDEPLFYLMAGF